MEQIENLYTPNSIRTFTGKYVNVLDPDPDSITIEDIAHSLSYQCRFGGHLSEFYSVAQHCIHCSELVPVESHKLAALLHDASEAYLIDVPRPVKQNLTNYKIIEDNLMRIISEKFGFPYPFSKEIKEVDEFMLQMEWDYLMLKKYRGIEPLSFDRAKSSFLNQFKLLTVK